MSTAAVGQAEILQKLSFLLWCLYALGLLGFVCCFVVFFSWSYLLFLNPLVGLCAQYFWVTPSTFCVYVFFSGAQRSPEGWRYHSSLSCFRVSKNKTLRPGKNRRRKHMLGRKYMYIFFSSDWKIKLPRGLKYSKGNKIRAQWSLAPRASSIHLIDYGIT